MNLFGWLKKDPEAKGYIRARAVAIPHYPSVESRSNVVENFNKPDSVSTLSVTLRLLKPGESAATIGSKYPRLPSYGAVKTTPTPEGCQRLHCNVPNWTHLLIRQERGVHREHAEVPVWVDPASGKMKQIDKEALLELLEPQRQDAYRLWEEFGMFDGPASGGKASTEEIPFISMFNSASESLTAMVSEAADEYKASVTASPEDAIAPDMSQYPPIEGVDFAKWIEISVALIKNRIAPANYNQFAESLGAPAGRWQEIDKAWSKRRDSDWKLGTLYGSECETALKKK